MLGDEAIMLVPSHNVVYQNLLSFFSATTGDRLTHQVHSLCSGLHLEFLTLDGFELILEGFDVELVVHDGT